MPEAQNEERRTCVEGKDQVRITFSVCLALQYFPRQALVRKVGPAAREFRTNINVDVYGRMAIFSKKKT
jgi:hypothetical protein